MTQQVVAKTTAFYTPLSLIVLIVKEAENYYTIKSLCTPVLASTCRKRGYGYNLCMTKEAFQYLLVIVLLTMITVSFGALSFDLINVYFPDIAGNACSYDGCTGSINGSLAVLIIAFPVFVKLWQIIQRDIAEDKEKANLRVRTVLLYLAIFISGIVLIADLITLVSGWLNGSLTLQFILKVIVVMVVAGMTFSYFRNELKQSSGSTRRLIGWTSIVLAVLAVVIGVWTSAPWEACERKIDQTRINDLQTIQSQIVSIFWTSKARLPMSLGELTDSISGFTAPRDPETNLPYEYKLTGARSFSLCAVFTTETKGPSKNTRAIPIGISSPMDITYSDTWPHGAGKSCFERTIDPDIYLPKIR